MNVTICSRKAAEELLRTDTLSRTAVISFCDPPSVGKPAPTPPLDYAGKAARVFTVVVHDLDLTALPDVGLDYDTYMPEADALAEEFAAASGYSVEEAPAESANAGFKDWFLRRFRRPGFTIEAGLGENPLPLMQLEEMVRRNAPLLAAALAK